MDRQYRIDPSSAWEGEEVDRFGALPYVVYLAAENIDDAHMRYITYRTCDDEEAIQMIRSGWFGCLANVEDLVTCQAIIGQQLQVFRVS